MNPKLQPCKKPYCFFCAMNEPNPLIRKSKLKKCFKDMPFVDDPEHVLVLSSLWNLAMNQPNDPEFPSLGIFQCMSNLINKGINDREWLLRDQNIYIPYYAAHIIGTYTMNQPEFAEKAVNSSVISPLLALLRGKISWVEQRVAIRALGHLATHEISFKKLMEYEDMIVESSIKVASTCLKVVFNSFVKEEETKRVMYHRDLLTRGVGDLEFENRKAEEWASQLQCWSLSLLDCFARRQSPRSLSLICDHIFLNGLGDMWGGLVNKRSTTGISLIRTLCHSKTGRFVIANSKQAILSLCNTSRSSDEWQYSAIDSLLQLLKDPQTRSKVIDLAVFYLKDLVEIRSLQKKEKVGEVITRVLLQDYSKIKYGQLKVSEETKRALEEVWEIRVERIKQEKLMNEEEIKEKKNQATHMKKQGNKLFWSGDVEGGLVKYTKALDLCPLNYRKERIVLHGNRAQCHLLMNDPRSAISDTTKSISLSIERNPHSKSLWRRSQAYDMINLARESLMDCLLFINCNKNSKGRKPRVEVSYHATRLIGKQMSATWIFAGVASTKSIDYQEDVEELKGDR